MGKKKGGFGLVYQDVTRSPEIPPAAKGLYAYLASYAGNGNECYPSVDLIRREMNMSKDSFYRYMKILVDLGIVEKMQTNQNGKFARNLYKISHAVDFSCVMGTDKPCPSKSDTEPSAAVNRGTNINSIKINNNNKNNNTYQLIADIYNDTCVSYSKITKLSDARKKAINARLKMYGIEDFKKLFVLAEKSSFLKGGNNRNWTASFDWLIKDANMAKVLDGNYDDRSEFKQAALSKNVMPYEMKSLSEYEIPEPKEDVFS